MAYHIIILVLLAVLACVSTFTIKSGNTNQTTHDTKGICLVEVPTVDPIHIDERHGTILRGNGSRSGLSKVQICCSGYTALQEHSEHRCIPDCPNGCDNGYCTAPNLCECKKGYTKGPDGNCIPTCPIGCPHGVCLLIKMCLCNAGYTLGRNRQVCRPICKGGCGIGGDCVRPNVCKCKAGFVKSYSGICQHHCEKGCVDGDCVGPNRCACKPGWTLNTKGTVCTPACTEPCLNGKCTAPDQCTCKTGYTKDVAEGNKCIAHCPSGCENGFCMAPYLCICNQGYTKGSNGCIKKNRRHARRKYAPFTRRPQAIVELFVLTH